MTKTAKPKRKSVSKTTRKQPKLVDKNFASSINNIFRQMKQEPDLLETKKNGKRFFIDEKGKFQETETKFDKKGKATDGSGIEIIHE